jgi:hypothetical protein
MTLILNYQDIWVMVVLIFQILQQCGCLYGLQKIILVISIF